MAKKKETQQQQVTDYDPSWGYSNQGATDSAPTDVPTPPPAQSMDTWISPEFLRGYGKPVLATIESVGAARGGNREYDSRKGWFVVFRVEEDGERCQGRVSEGDHRHVRLYDKYKADWVGKKVRLRLPNPGDRDQRGTQTKALWTLDAL